MAGCHKPYFCRIAVRRRVGRRRSDEGASGGEGRERDGVWVLVAFFFTWQSGDRSEEAG
jgi:hypothetical protein